MHPAFYWWHKHARGERGGEGVGESTSGGESASDSVSACGPGFGRGRRERRHERGHHGHGGHHPHEERLREAFFGGFGGFGGPGGPGGPDAGPFGVRRPLRFLANKLELSESQISDLARILDELKTERAQADVDHRRTVAAFADAVEAPTFGEPRAKEGGEQRVKSAERLRDAVVKALSQIHALLDEDQRKRMAYMIRTGVLQL